MPNNEPRVDYLLDDPTMQPNTWDVPEFEAPKNETLRKEEATLMTAATSGIPELVDGTDVDMYRANYDQLGSTSMENAAQSIAQPYLQPEFDALDGFVAYDPETVVEYEDSRKALLSDPSAMHRMAIETMSQVDDLSTEVEIARSYAAYRVMQMLDNTSVTDRTLNLASDFFLPVNTKDRNDFLDGLYEGDAEVDFSTAVANFIALDPKDQVDMYPALEQWALEATDGNQDRAGKLLMELYNLQDVSSGWDMFNDILIVGPAAVAGLAKVAKAGSFVSTLSRVNKKATADLIVASAKSDEVAEVTGITQRTAGESASPFRWSEVSADAIDGVEPEIVRGLETTAEETVKAVQEMEQSLIKRSPLTLEEQQVAQQRALAKFEKESDKLRKENGWAATNARITKTDENGFTVEYDLMDANGNPLNAKPQVIDYTRSDVGVYAENKVSGAGSILFSPSTWANRSQENVVELATAIGFTQEKALADLMGIANTAMKGLNGKSTARVDDVLLMGDEFKDAAGNVVGKVFTPHELMVQGLPGVGRLTQKEAEAYYRMRTFWDELHRMSRNEVIREWRFNGVQRVGDFAGEGIYGNVIKGTDLPSSAKKIVNLETRTVDDVALLQERIAKGELEVVRLQRNIEKGDEIFEYAVTPRGKARRVNDFDPDVLPKKEGYVPLIRTKSYYFVEASSARMINGVKGNVPQVVRSFDNSEDAAKWAAQQEATTGTKHQVRYDREVGTELKSDLQQSQFGKPIFGSRVQDRDILFGMNGSTPERLSASEALQRNIDAIAQTMPMNQFRMAQMEKWHNSAKPYLIDPKNPDSGFKAGLANQHVQSLIAMRKWLDDQMRIPTTGEQQWAGMMRAAAEKMEGTFIGNRNAFFGLSDFTVSQKAHELAKVDPFASLRGAAFHTLLGWFNPAQLLVQAMGSTLAIGLNPVKFPKIAQEFMMVRAVYNGSDDAVKAVAKAFGKDQDEFLELVKGYRRSGIRESLKTTADYNAAQLGYSFDAAAVRTAYGAGGNALKQFGAAVSAGTGKLANEGGLMFFRAGESWNRGYSWLLAADEYKSLNKIKKLTDADIDAITQQSLKYTMNMNRANRADWQKGIASIPTQFLQVNAKFLETMLPRLMGGSNKALTAKQKSAILLSQLGLFGAAGVPMGDMLVNEYLSFSGAKPGDLSAEEIATIRQGVAGLVGKLMVGDEIEISERFAFGSGFNQLMETLTSGNKEFGEIMAGAAGAFPSRVLEVAGSLYPRMANPQFSVSEAKAIGNELAGITSTWRNVSKARLMYQLGEIRTTSGEVVDLFDPENNMGLIYAQGLGFQPSQLAEYYGHKSYQRALAQVRSDVLKSLELNYKQFLSGDITDPRWKERYQKINETLVSTLDPVEGEKVWATWAERMNQDSKLLKLRDASIKQYFDSQNATPSTFGSKPLQTLQE